MINGKQFADVMDFLAEQRRLIEGRDRSPIIFVCEQTVHMHVASGEWLYRAEEGLAGKTGPKTNRWGTCPLLGHRSRHFFTQHNGRTAPAPCRMHPVPPHMPMKPEHGDALDAAHRMGGWVALVEGLKKHAKFDPFYWRLWDLTCYYQRQPVAGEYAG